MLNWARSLHDRRVHKWARDQELPQELDNDEDLMYLRGLDPVEWKDQDHYRVMGLRHLRQRASEDDIKKFCKWFGYFCHLSLAYCGIK